MESFDAVWDSVANQAFAVQDLVGAAWIGLLTTVDAHPLLRLISDQCTTLLDISWSTFIHFWRHEIPSLLSLLSRSLQRAKIPASVKEARRFTMSDWLDIAPILAGLGACVATPAALLASDTAKITALQRKKDADVDLRDSYWLTREALLRGMGLCYFCGFCVSAIQHRALWGSLGLMPIGRNPSGRPTPAFAFLDYLGWGYGDWQLELVSWVGAALAAQMMLGRFRSFLIPLALWTLYLSIVNLQAPFTYSYGWEWLTCEVGFLCIFLCPICARGFASWTPPPRLVLWLIRWAAFRLLLGAGMSKVGRNSSACWRQLSCTSTHYFTQPVPNPVSWFAHHLPESLHRVEVALTFFEQLVLPFFMLVPMRSCRLFAGILEISFQFAIVATGSYAWINFIGALPCLAMLDDAFLSWVTPRRVVEEARQAARRALLQEMPVCRRFFVRLYRSIRLVMHVALVAVMIYKSKDPIKELFGPAPWINSYDKWFLMNSQGVFGFINQHRVQIVLRYTHDEQPGSPYAVWKPLDFKCLPGSVERRPCLMSPYHYRLDWETWIRVTASLEQLWQNRVPAHVYHEQMPEFIQTLVVRIMSGDDDAIGLMGVPHSELYRNGEPPTAISIDFASYTFTGKQDKTGSWWDVESVGPGSLAAYGREGSRLPPEQVRKSPRERHWVLGFSIIGSALVLDRLWCRPVTAVVAAVVLVDIFGLVLLSDYADMWQVAERVMPLAQKLPSCVGGLQSQRCCYEYVKCCSGFGAFLALISMLEQLWKCRRRSAAKGPGFSSLVADVLLCVAFAMVAQQSASVVVS